MKTFVTIALYTILIYSSHTQQALKKGENAPVFYAKTTSGKTINLKDIIASKQVVLMFYRGQWCPYCNKQMSELQDSLHLINEIGAKVIAITPEKPEEIDKTIEKTGASFDIIYDKDHRIMDLYNVTFTLSKTKNVMYKAWGIDINKASGNDDYALPVPATYIINNDGKIKGLFFDENYKNRMTVKKILEVLKQ